MRLANLDGRAVLISPDGSDPTAAVDVHKVSDGRFGPELESVYAAWPAFAAWVASAAQSIADAESEPVDPARLGAPSPSPRQIVAIGLNYQAHADESGFDAPSGLPPVFPKFVSSLTGPVTTVTLPEGGNTDWEVELVAVIGRETSNVTEDEAWDHVAGLTLGQDLSERVIQLAGPAPQFGLGKSYPGFAPTGPWLVTTDELADRDNVSLTATLDGEVVQEGSTSNLIVPVARLVAELSKVITLYPGDLLFTGTPEGVGLGRKPQRFIQPGQVLVSRAEGIGELRQEFVAQGATSTATNAATSAATSADGSEGGQS
ncbi:2-keto-4-pentenoate hydratase/2-oxohepta-3-ene-1,7-dioic acid hydratase in catechol pathway [Knoellia remsis]|uniref:2-keto-4-pentenoate hydratase/2-oxohepta-3-ene-1,7-dioic acid hydratase in catechol pathway n=1 Tax=Knoellia remsis TaxID=407159 RepID=A0A2T0UMY5_9MICO|nr:fumarylacetoacetate hydrolase family protein [Knoellia remsis]PRY59282.1 2-keto-4-pentenoate hydratase/2-oxohepta-3-ene-1,7-dioic acid hydratase in catechol pathway [Knoellia remsis]